MVLGHLRSEGVRECLTRIDPRNVRIRLAITGHNSFTTSILQPARYLHYLVNLVTKRQL